MITELKSWQILWKWENELDKEIYLLYEYITHLQHMNIIFADISPTAKFVVGHPFLILKGYKHFLILKVPNKSILPKFQINTSSQLVYPTQFNYSQPFFMLSFHSKGKTKLLVIIITTLE